MIADLEAFFVLVFGPFAAIAAGLLIALVIVLSLLMIVDRLIP